MTRRHAKTSSAAPFLLLVVATVLLSCPSRAIAADAAPGPRSATLVSSPSSPLVAIRVVLQSGSQNDPPGKEGLAALTAAMVAEGGTKSLTYDQLLEAFYPMAATLDG